MFPHMRNTRTEVLLIYLATFLTVLRRSVDAGLFEILDESFGLCLLVVLVEHGELRVSVHAQPVLGVVNCDEVLDQLFIGLADDPALPFRGTEHQVIVQRVVDDGEPWKNKLHHVSMISWRLELMARICSCLKFEPAIT